MPSNLDILTYMAQGLSKAQIAKRLKLSEPTISYHVKRLIATGFVELKVRSSYCVYELTAKGKEAITNRNLDTFSSRKTLAAPLTPIDVHSLKVKYPILKDNPEAKIGKEVQINNWIKQYAVTDLPIGITIERTPKHIIAHFHRQQLDRNNFLTDFYSLVTRGTYWVHYYLKHNFNIEVDLLGGEVIAQHIADELSPKEAEGVHPNTTFSLDLRRPAKSVLPTDIRAVAWLDRSGGHNHRESTDLLYEQKVLMMPETIAALDHKLTPAIEALTEQINLHLEVLKELRTAIQDWGKKV